MTQASAHLPTDTTLPAPTVPAHEVPVGAWRTLAVRPEPERLPRGIDALWNIAASHLVMLKPRTRRYLRLAHRVIEREPRYAAFNDTELRDAAATMRETFR